MAGGVIRHAALLHRLAVQRDRVRRGDGVHDGCVAAPGGKQALLAHDRANCERQAILLPARLDRCLGMVALAPGVRLAVVLVEHKAVVCAGEDVQLHVHRVLDPAPANARPQRYDGPRPGKDRNVVPAAIDHLPAPTIRFAGEEIEPETLRQPDGLAAEAHVRRGRGREGRGDQLAAKPVGLRAVVGVVNFGVRVIERRHQRDALHRVAPGHAVEVGDQGVAQLHGCPRRRLDRRPPPPRAAILVGVVCAVQPQDWAEDAILHPAQIELRLLYAPHVAADVVAPPAIGDVGRRGGEGGLESQRLPTHDRVAGKADRVAVTAQPAPAREDEGALFALAPHVIEVQMVEPPERVEAAHLGRLALLPVQPPEVQAVRLFGVVQQRKIGSGKARIGDVKFHRFAAGGIDAHCICHRRVLRLMRVDAVGGMQVKCRAQPLGVQPGDQTPRVGEQGTVPGITRPAYGAVAGLSRVPVHIDDADGERNLACAKLFHQSLQGRLIVSPEAAPPVAQQVAGNQRRLAGHLLEVLQAPDVVVAITKEVEVKVVGCGAGRHPAIRRKDERLRIIHHGPAITRQQPRLQADGAVRLVQRARGALEIARFPDAVAIAPGDTARLQRDREGNGREAAAVFAVVQQ